MSDTQKTPIARGGTRPPPVPTSSPNASPGPGTDDRARWAEMKSRADAVTQRTPSVSEQGADANEGEGNRTAARRYNDAAERHAASGSVEAEARAARRALDVDDGRLSSAERAGRAPAKLSVVDRAVGLVNRLRRALQGRPHR